MSVEIINGDNNSIPVLIKETLTTIPVAIQEADTNIPVEVLTNESNPIHTSICSCSEDMILNCDSNIKI